MILNLSSIEILIIGILFLVSINCLATYLCSFVCLNTFNKTKSHSQSISKLRVYDTFILNHLMLITHGLYIILSYTFFVELLKVSDFFITLSITLGFVLSLITTFIARLPYCYACNILLKTKFSEKECFIENLFDLLKVFFPLFLISFVISSAYILPVEEGYIRLIIAVFITIYLVLNVLLSSQKEITRLKAKKINEGEIKDTLDNLFISNNIKRYKLYYWDSFKSNEDNAFISGVITSNLLISTTLLEKLTKGELEAVVLHEIGHIKKHHILKRIIGEVIFLIAILISLYVILILDKFNIFTMALLLFAFILFLGVDISTSKKEEQAADLFVASKGYGKELISALKKTSFEEEEKKNKLDKVISTHPSIKKRIKDLDEK